MPLSHLVLNETTDNNERGLKSQYHNQIPIDTSITFPMENCFRYATIKISYYSTLDSILIIKFFPKHLYRVLSGDIKDGHTYDSSLVSCPTHTLNITGNKYELHTFPIQGEFFQVSIYSNAGENHIYYNAGLSNFNQNTHLE
tara:strand:+ start:360 stop:785 length:426 start_codon:yes stop_codon:yes gene_type:complete